MRYPQKNSSAWYVLDCLRGRESFTREEITQAVTRRFCVHPSRVDKAVRWLRFSPFLQMRWNDESKRWDVLFVASDPKEASHEQDHPSIF